MQTLKHEMFSKLHQDIIPDKTSVLFNDFVYVWSIILSAHSLRGICNVYCALFVSFSFISLFYSSFRNVYNKVRELYLII